VRIEQNILFAHSGAGPDDGGDRQQRGDGDASLTGSGGVPGQWLRQFDLLPGAVEHRYGAFRLMAIFHELLARCG
jgi:hypothetical protein